MKKLIISLGLLYVVVSATICHAAVMTGNELLDKCGEVVRFLDQKTTLGDDILYKAGSCLGMMEGITTLGAVYQDLLKRNALFCTPSNGIQNGQAARVVVKYLKEHPEKLYEPALALVMSAFREAYPCDKKYTTN